MDLFKVSIWFGLVALAALQDPCRKRNHHAIRDAYNRSTGFVLPDDMEPNNDRFLEEGWYRFNSPAGSNMPTQPPPMKSCGTQFPIWLDVIHSPADEDGVHRATACVVGFDSDCTLSYDIKVKECRNFQAYYLVPTLGAAESYCIGSEIQCPANTISPNGFTPNCVPENVDRNTIQKKTTAKEDSIRTGTGSVIEVMSRSDTNMTISCYSEVIPELHLPPEAVDHSDHFEATISQDKSGEEFYVTSHISQKVMSRFELRDLLHGLGWKMIGHALVSQSEDLIHNEIWLKPRKSQP